MYFIMNNIASAVLLQYRRVYEMKNVKQYILCFSLMKKGTFFTSTSSDKFKPLLKVVLLTESN